MSKKFKLFLTLLNCVIKCKTDGKRIKWGAGYGLEIAFQCMLFGPRKIVDWAEKSVREIIDSAGKALRKVLSNNLRRNIWVLLPWKMFF